MALIGADEGISYGFNLLGYMIAVGLASIVTIAIGAFLFQNSTGGFYSSANTGGMVLGGLIVIVGVLVFWAGMMGLQYKVAADAHYRAIQETEEV